MPRIMPEARYFSMPSVEVGAELRRKGALNCWPCVRSLTHSPEAVTHSPAEIVAACPTVVTSSRCPRALTRRTQKPFSALWKVTRSTRPASTSCADKLGYGFSPPFTRRQTPCSQKFPKSIIITWSPSTRFRLIQGVLSAENAAGEAIMDGPLLFDGTLPAHLYPKSTLTCRQAVAAIPFCSAPNGPGCRP